MLKKIKKALWLMKEENAKEEVIRKAVAYRIEGEMAELEYRGKNQYALLSRSLNEVLLNTVIRSRDLLVAKGFPNTLTFKTEKFVLLGTELSELADAVKKGKGNSEEGEELADIAIRLSNFLSADEIFDQYIKLSEVFWKYQNEFSQLLIVHTCNTNDVKGDIVQIKYEVVQQMMIVNEEIRKKADLFMRIGLNNADPVPLIELWYSCLKMIALCQVYAEGFLPENLQFYINYKMDKNFQRPYKYNTFEELKE